MNVKELSEKIAFTLKGCPACAEFEKEYQAEIEAGIIEIKECDLESKDPKKLQNCLEAKKMPQFDGFPSVYNRETHEKLQ